MPKLPALPPLRKTFSPVVEIKSLVYESQPSPLLLHSDGQASSPSSSERYSEALQYIKNGSDALPHCFSHSATPEDLSQVWDVMFERGFASFDASGFANRIDYQTSTNLLSLARHYHRAQDKISSSSFHASASTRAASTSTYSHPSASPSSVQDLRERFREASRSAEWNLLRPLVVASARLHPGLDRNLDNELNLWAARTLAEGQSGAEKILQVAQDLGADIGWVKDPATSSQANPVLVGTCTLHPSIMEAFVVALSILPDIPSLSSLLPEMSGRIRSKFDRPSNTSNTRNLLNAIPGPQPVKTRALSWLQQVSLSHKWYRTPSNKTNTRNSIWLSNVRRWVERSESHRLLEVCDAILSAADPRAGDDCWLPTLWPSVSETRKSYKDPTAPPPRFIDRNSTDKPSLYLDPELVTFFLYGFIRLGMSDAAAQTWKYLVSRKLPITREIWNGVLRGHAEVNRPKEAHETFESMQSAGIAPSLDAWTFLVRSHVSSKEQYLPNEPNQNRIECQKWFQNMKEAAIEGKIPEISKWPSKTVGELSYSLFNAGLDVDAEQLLHDFLLSGQIPESGLMNVFLRHYSQAGQLQRDRLIFCFDIIKKYNIRLDTAMISVLIDNHLRSQKDNPEEAVMRAIDFIIQHGTADNSATFQPSESSKRSNKSSSSSSPENLANSNSSSSSSYATEPEQVNLVTYGIVIDHVTKNLGVRGLSIGLALLDRAERSSLRKSNEVLYTMIIQAACEAAIQNPDPFVDPIEAPTFGNPSGKADISSLQTEPKLEFQKGHAGSLANTTTYDPNRTRKNKIDGKRRDGGGGGGGVDVKKHRSLLNVDTQSNDRIKQSYISPTHSQPTHPYMDFAESLWQRMTARNFPLPRTGYFALLQGYLVLARTSRVQGSLKRALDIFEMMRHHTARNADAQNRKMKISNYSSNSSHTSYLDPHHDFRSSSSSSSLSSGNSPQQSGSIKSPPKDDNSPSTLPNSTTSSTIPNTNQEPSIYPSTFAYEVLLESLLLANELDLAKAYADQLESGKTRHSIWSWNNNSSSSPSPSSSLPSTSSSGATIDNTDSISPNIPFIPRQNSNLAKILSKIRSHRR